MPYTNNQIKSFLKEIQKANFKSVITYRGRKHKELAFALNYILIYAKDYTRFVDLFAGSGTASANVIIDKPKHEFVLNDADFAMAKFFSIFAVIKADIKTDIKAGIIRADLLRKNVITEFNSLQASLQGRTVEDVKKIIKDYEDELRDFHNIYMNNAKLIAYILLIYHPSFDWDKLSNNKTTNKKLNDFCNDTLFPQAEDYIKQVFEYYQGFISESNCLNSTLPDSLKHLCDNKSCVIYVDPPYLGSNTGTYDAMESQDMISLIDNICDSEQQFIYSCYPRAKTVRGVLGVKQNKIDYIIIDDRDEVLEEGWDPDKDLPKDANDNYIAQAPFTEIFDKNTDIYKTILHEFEYKLKQHKQKQPNTEYYVVAICRYSDNKVLPLLTQLEFDSERFEIMITNIKPDLTPNVLYKRGNIQYGLNVVSLSVFNRIVRENVYLDTKLVKELFTSLEVCY